MEVVRYLSVLIRLSRLSRGEYLVVQGRDEG